MSAVDWPFVHHERVRFGDLDAMRHLNNVVFLRYFETARIAYLRELVPGHDPAHPEAGGFGLIFAACEIAYRSPATFDEEVAVRCRAEKPGTSSFRVAFQMAVGERLSGRSAVRSAVGEHRADSIGRAPSERIIAEGHGVLVGYDYEQGRSRPLPDALRAAIEA